MMFQCALFITLLNIFVQFLGLVTSQDTSANIPLAQKRFPWPNLPYQADTGTGVRGPQTGYNLCNATTQTQDSKCQTSWLDSIEDEHFLRTFIFQCSSYSIPAKPNSVVGDIEESMIAYCTKKTYGARMIPAGAIQGLQLTRTPGYIQIVGQIDQTGLNIKKGDEGGELDPHGADLRGNPLGGLVYSKAFSKKSASEPVQVIEWTSFIGSDTFCFKACDPADPNGPRLCEHVYDRSGCEYNMPANYAAIKGTFQSCKGENQLPVGVYVEEMATKTWQQPPETAGPLGKIPYRPWVPPSSDCTFYTSASLFSELGGQRGPAKQTPAPTTDKEDKESGNLFPIETTKPQRASKSDGGQSFSQVITVSLIVASCAGVGFALVL